MKIKRTIGVFIMNIMLMTACGSNNGVSSLPNTDYNNVPLPDDISGLSSLEITHLITAGWNLGNTLDAHWGAAIPWLANPAPQETEIMWGNPVTTKQMIDKVKASGFNTVRIPVTWYMYTGPGPEYVIDNIWMNRVQEVVDYVIKNKMFCILNTHHEDHISGVNKDGKAYNNGWLRLYNKNESRALNETEKTEIKNRLCKIWEQIAERFKNYDEYLIFEGVNEPRTEGIGDISKQMWIDQSDFLNVLLQSFINTVRAGGGKNLNRHLMVTPYYANAGTDPADSEGRIAAFVDRAAGKLFINDLSYRLIVSLHYYEPWGFAAAPPDSQWHSWYFDLKVGSVSYNIENVLKVIGENFTGNKIPVIMGETGAIHRMMPGRRTNEAERVKWADYYIAKLKELGVPSVIWDDGGDFLLLDRKKVEWKYPDLAAAIVRASKTPVK